MSLNQAPRWGKRSPCSRCLFEQSCTKCCNLARQLAEGEKAVGRMTTTCRWLLPSLSLQATGKWVAAKGIFLLGDGPEDCTGLGAALLGIPGGRKLTVWGGGGLHNKPCCCCCPERMKDAALECWGRPGCCCRGRWLRRGEEGWMCETGEELKCSGGEWKRSVSWQNFWLSTRRLCSFFLMAPPLWEAPPSSPSVSSS